jgi:GNAT superfamily N-acetyltransferase
MNLHIEQITPQLTWTLRQEILYPNSTVAEMHMEEDDTGLHFGGFIDNQLIGVVSLFERDNSFQFRKFAIRKAYQKKGFGTEMLIYLENHVKQSGAGILWCNARITAADFYIRSGFVRTGNLFSKNGFDYEVLVKEL